MTSTPVRPAGRQTLARAVLTCVVMTTLVVFSEALLPWSTNPAAVEFSTGTTGDDIFARQLSAAKERQYVFHNGTSVDHSLVSDGATRDHSPCPVSTQWLTLTEIAFNLLRVGYRPTKPHHTSYAAATDPLSQHHTSYVAAKTVHGRDVTCPGAVVVVLDYVGAKPTNLTHIPASALARCTLTQLSGMPASLQRLSNIFWKHGHTGSAYLYLCQWPPLGLGGDKYNFLRQLSDERFSVRAALTALRV